MTFRAPFHGSRIVRSRKSSGDVGSASSVSVTAASRIGELRMRREPLAGGGALHHVIDPDADAHQRPAVLLCHGFVQSASAFVLPTRSLVQYLVREGFAPYVLELPVPTQTRERRLFGVWDGFAHYANVVAPKAVERLGAQHPELAWLGHSMGGIIGASLPDFCRRSIGSLVAIGAPLLPAIPGGRGANRAFMKSARALAGAGIPLPGKALARQLQRVVRWLDRPGVGYPLQLWYPQSMEEHEIWFSLNEGFDDDSWAALADLIELGLSDGERAGAVAVGERVRSWEAPALIIAADRDGLVPLASSKLLFDRLGCAHKEFFEVGAKTTGCSAGHIDVLVGAHAAACVWPRISMFLHQHMTMPAHGAAGLADSIPR